jgi:hypothetical protein
MASAYSRISLARSEKDVVLHDLKATLACLTAASRSSSLATGTSDSAEPVAGLIECRVWGVATISLLMMLPLYVWIVVSRGGKFGTDLC